MHTLSAHTADPLAPASPLAHMRLASLDVLRGVAILGVLPLIIQAQAEPWTASINPATGGPLSGANGILWIITYILFTGKFLTILSTVFGAGIFLMASRTDAASSKNKAGPFSFLRAVAGGANNRTLHNRRMAGLSIIGLALVWHALPAAMLVLFAICGVLAFPLSLWPAQRAAFAGALCLAFGALCLLGAGALLKAFDTIEINQTMPVFGVFTSSARFNFLVLFAFLSRTLGLMLIGMALLKWGAFQTAWPARRHIMIITVALFIGYPLVILGILENVSHRWSMAYAIGVGSQFNYWGALIIAGGYASFIMLVCKYAAGKRFRKIMTAIGRMPLSNIAIQIMVSAWVFFPPDAAFTTQTDRLEEVILAGIIALAQIILSPFWLRYFRYGPFEWVWRWMTTGQRPPFIFMNRVFSPYIRAGGANRDDIRRH